MATAITSKCGYCKSVTVKATDEIAAVGDSANVS